MAALLKMDDYVDKWSFVISAPWITDENRDESFDMIFSYFRDLSSDHRKSIGRFGLYDNQTHLIKELLNRKEGSSIKNEKINGNFINEGEIIISNENPSGMGQRLPLE
ncbi:hypothetical protein N9L18_00670 [Candidatus Pacebacteria bacterium]|nr:hypothetical protein [Candidatus Paceibacterota bacterium]